MFQLISNSVSTSTTCEMTESQASASFTQENVLNRDKNDKIQSRVLSLFSQAFAHIPECPPSEERIYLNTNEENTEETFNTLKSKPLTGNTMLATSGFFALNAVAIRGQDQGQTLDYIIMIDNSIRTQKLWQETEKIIRQFSLVGEALAEIKKMMQEKADELWISCERGSSNCVQTPGGRAAIEIRDLETEITRKVSWLSSQPSYDRIKRIFEADHFVFKRLDLFDKKSVRLLSETIKQLGLTLDSSYLSNLREYAEAQNQLPEFHESLEELRQTMTDQTASKNLYKSTKERIDTLAKQFC